MKIDITYRHDGWINRCIGNGSFVRAGIHFYDKCEDKPDCRAGRGWPVGTMYRTYSPCSKTFDILIGSKTEDMGELFSMSLDEKEKHTNTKIGYCGDELQENISNMREMPLGIFRCNDGMPISVFRGLDTGGVTLDPEDWRTVECAYGLLNELVRYTTRYDLIESKDIVPFCEFLEKIIKNNMQEFISLY